MAFFARVFFLSLHAPPLRSLVSPLRPRRRVRRVVAALYFAEPGTVLRRRLRRRIPFPRLSRAGVGDAVSPRPTAAEFHLPPFPSPPRHHPPFRPALLP